MPLTCGVRSQGLACARQPVDAAALLAACPELIDRLSIR